MKKKIIILFAIVMTIVFASPAKTKAYDGDTWLNLKAQGYVKEIAKKYNIQPELIEAVIETESSCKNTASNGLCYGYMQINGKVWGYNYKSEYANISKGTEILANCFERAEGEVCLALDLYNGNSKAYKLYEAGQISKYAKKVTTRAHELEVLHYGG